VEDSATNIGFSDSHYIANPRDVRGTAIRILRRVTQQRDFVVLRQTPQNVVRAEIPTVLKWVRKLLGNK
jgi:hypothetical protein